MIDRATPGAVLFGLVSGGLGGGQRVALGVAERLVDRGLQLIAFAPDDGPSLDEFRALGSQTVILGPIRTFDIQMIRTIAAVVGDYPRPCVYTHTVLAHEAMFGLAAKRQRARLVIHRHIKGALSPSPLTRRYQSLLWKRAMRYADDVICVSEEVREQVRSWTGRDAHVVQNGVPIPTSAPETSSENGLVGYVGRFDPNKGFEEFVRAAALVRERRADVRFLAVGGAPPNDPYARRCEQLVTDLGLDSAMEFAGQRPAAELMGSLDIFVLPSHLEGHPLALLEAMSLGKAIVATNIGGVRETITDDVDGVVVPVGDYTAIAAAILRLLDEPGLRERLGSAARTRAIANFSEDRMVDELVPLVLGESPR